MNEVVRSLVDLPEGARLFVTDEQAGTFEYTRPPGKVKKVRKHRAALRLISAQIAVRRKADGTLLCFRRDSAAGGYWVYRQKRGGRAPAPSVRKHYELHEELERLGFGEVLVVPPGRAGVREYPTYGARKEYVQVPSALNSLRAVFKKQGIRLSYEQNKEGYSVRKIRLGDRETGAGPRRDAGGG